VRCEEVRLFIRGAEGGGGERVRLRPRGTDVVVVVVVIAVVKEVVGVVEVGDVVCVSKS
jgi:hypothetical protein